MSRFLKTRTGRMFVAAVTLTLPARVYACTSCYGQTDSPLAQGMNWGIMVLLGVIVSVLAGIVTFFVHVGRKSASLNNSAAAENQTEKKQ